MLRAALKGPAAQSSVRRIMSFPVYNNPADPDPEKDKKFDIEFGIKEEVAEPREDMFFFLAPFTDTFYRAKLVVMKFFGENLPYRQSAQELEERRVLNDRLHEFYSSIPQSYPDEAWWNDCIDHYVRYNDYDGAKKMHDWLHVQRLNVSPAIIEKFQRFFYENDPHGLFRKSNIQRIRENDEFLPERDEENFWRRGREGI